MRNKCGLWFVVCGLWFVSATEASAQVCPAGNTYCGAGVCRDLQSERQNCGACGNACSATQICEQGACQNVGTYSTNGVGCSTDTHAAIIKRKHLGFAPASSTGAPHIWTTSIELTQNCGGTMINFPSAQAYLSGFSVAAEFPTAYQSQDFALGISKQNIRAVQATPQSPIHYFLDLTLRFVSVARSQPQVVPHDGDSVIMYFEVIAHNPAYTDIVLQRVKFDAVAPGSLATHTEAYLATTDFIAAPLTYINLRSRRTQYPFGGGTVYTGTNIFNWGVTTGITSITPNDVTIETNCISATEPSAPTSDETYCYGQRLLIFGKSGTQLVRAITQPSMTISDKLSVLPSVANMAGSGSSGKPICGLGSFRFYQPNSNHGFKFKKLGMYVNDCDHQIFSGNGQPGVGVASGATAEHNTVTNQEPNINLAFPPTNFMVDQEAPYSLDYVLESGALQ